MFDSLNRWLRNKFGKCIDRWSHDWKLSRRCNETEVGDTRTCSVCGGKQICVGHYAFMDASPMPQWEDVIDKNDSGG